MVWCVNCHADRDGSHDQVAGNVCCEVCGLVIEESSMVNEVAFSEDSHVIGQFVGETSSTRHLRGIPGTQTDSREQTLEKAKRNIQTIASKLNITEDLVDAAHRFYRLALESNFTKGRRSVNVSAACLYCVCRIEKKPIMLLDFSEHLQEDVFVLGRCYTALCNCLKLDIPLIEPWFYIRRFSAKLEFGNKQNAVCTTSMKLVSRFKRDWMETGRRPAGLCAAALIIAARIHGFRRSQEDIANVARICSSTVSKRLQEFSQTTSAKLSPDEFDKYGEDIDEEMNPPSFQKHLKKKAKKKKSRLRDEEEDLDREDEEEDENEEVEGKFGKEGPEMEDVSSKTDLKDDKLMGELEKELAGEEIKTLEKDISAAETNQEQFLFETEIPSQNYVFPDDDGKLDELDEDEMEDYLVKDEEILKRKREIMESEYGEFLEEMERKQLEKAEAELNASKKPKKQRKKKDSRDEPPAKSAAEATANMLKKKGGRKIPGVITEKLFDTSELKVVPKILVVPKKKEQIEEPEDIQSIISQYKF